jgi:hypothetical protein
MQVTRLSAIGRSMRRQSHFACWTRASVSAIVFGPTAQEPPPARLTVYETVSSGRATNRYAVTNKSDRPIVRVEIGEHPTSGELTLTPAPVGWGSRLFRHGR